MRIAILTNWPEAYTSQALLKAAKKRGHKAVVIDVMQCYVEMAQARPSVHYNGRIIESIDAIIPRFSPVATAYGASILRQFEMQGVFTTTKSLAIVRASDKLRSTQLLSREGIDIPKTVFASQPRDIQDLMHLVGGAPVVIKLVEGSQGLGVALAETTKAAQSVIQAFYALKANFLVQEYIDEANSTDIRALVVGGKVVGSMKRQGPEGEFRSNLHQGGKAEPVQLSSEERRIAIKAARAVGLQVAGVDMLPSDRGLLVIEVNSAPGLEGIEGATGKDIAGRIIEHVEANVNRRPQKDKVGA